MVFGKANQQGLTLVEIMLAVAILGVLLLFVVQLFDFGSQQKRESDTLAQQGAVAEYLAARIIQGELALTLGSFTDVQAWPLQESGRDYYYQVTVTAPSAAGQATMAAITVSPPQAGSFAAGGPDNFTLMLPVVE